MIKRLDDNIYSYPIPLPNNPLRSINNYVIMGKERHLIIDSGFRHPDCLAAMEAGLNELGVELNKSDFFYTHLHSDHTGLMSALASPDSRIYMHSIDRALLRRLITGPDSFRGETVEQYTREGYPEDRVRLSLANNPAIIYAPNRDMPIIEVGDGDIIEAAGVRFSCIHTPGHTPGHTCLYWPERQILFAGDQILYTITPNITTWPGEEDSLGDYISSLDRLKELPIKRAFAAHRDHEGDLPARIESLKQHHIERLESIEKILRGRPGISGYEVASLMKWSIRVNSWEDFPESQKWFAVGEALSHLDYLRLRGRVTREQEGGRNLYYPA